jgi:hypothetical protein
MRGAYRVGPRPLGRFGLLAMLVVSDPANAARLSLEANTSFPRELGVRAAAELPVGLRLSTSFGFLPAAYLAVVNDLAVEFDIYARPEADFVERTIDRSFTWAVHVGWLPIPGAGFFVDAGYGLVLLGGRTTSEDALATFVGVPAPIPDRRYKVASTIHMLDVEIGWRWLFGEWLLVRFAVGGTFTLGASSEIEPSGAPFPVEGVFTELARKRLDELYESSLHLPTVSFGVGIVL